MTFEELRDRLAGLDVPVGNARRLVWIVPERLGAAMTANGAYEIFLGGLALSANSPVVTRHLHHDNWEPSDGGSTFSATRILLGSAAHFAAMAAVIAIELARFDLVSDEAMQRAFNDVEPIIELAIRRGALSTEALIGLLAELHFLRVVLLSVPVAKRDTALLGWRGWTKGRDFKLGLHAVEIKATLGDRSRHSFSGVHQLEASLTESGDPEKLHLMSFGLTSTDYGGQSLPDLVSELVSLLENDNTLGASICAQFISMVREYGGLGPTGYDHITMKEWIVYQEKYAINFARLYSVDDPEMKLITTALIDQTFAVPGTVSFEMQFPTRISSFNPAANWQTEVAWMVEDLFNN